VRDRKHIGDAPDVRMLDPDIEVAVHSALTLWDAQSATAAAANAPIVLDKPA